MDSIKDRLIASFETVFPEMPKQEIPAASQSTVPAWDSIAAITLVNVIEDEFQIELDLDRIAELDSFQRIQDYLQSVAQVS